MKKAIIFRLLIFICMALGIISCSREKKTIRIYDGSWGSIWAANAIAKVIIEDGYGYPVEIKSESEAEMIHALQNNQLNLCLEMWENVVTGAYDLEGKQVIFNLGEIYDSGPQFWMIPRWIAEEYGIKSVFDMIDHWQLFRNPENPNKGLFINGLIIWDSSKINTLKLQAYGLDSYFDEIVPNSSAVEEAAFLRAMKNNQPVFGYYWAPTYLMGSYDWYILEEPEYDEEIWNEILSAIEKNDYTSIETACAYEDRSVNSYANKEMLKNAPDVIEMLKKMKIDLDVMNELLAWNKQSDHDDWDQTAIYFFKNYEDLWNKWVTQEAFDNIKMKLMETE